MLRVCHTTPTQNGSVCMSFVSLGHHDGSTAWPQIGEGDTKCLSQTQRHATASRVEPRFCNRSITSQVIIYWATPTATCLIT